MAPHGHGHRSPGGRGKVSDQLVPVRDRRAGDCGDAVARLGPAAAAAEFSSTRSITGALETVGFPQ